MGIYHLFPVVLYATAPLLALGLAPAAVPAPGRDGVRRPVHLLYAVAGVALLLVGLSAPPNGMGSVFYSLLRSGFPMPGEIFDAHGFVREYARTGGRIAVDDGVMSLEPVLLENVPLLPRVQDPGALDSAMVFPRYYLGHESTRTLLTAWARDGARVDVECLPGGMARMRKGPSPGEARQTPNEVFDRLLACHPLPRR
jgi:hypothetical protein